MEMHCWQNKGCQTHCTFRCVTFSLQEGRLFVFSFHLNFQSYQLVARKNSFFKYLYYSVVSAFIGGKVFANIKPTIHADFLYALCPGFDQVNQPRPMRFYFFFIYKGCVHSETFVCASTEQISLHEWGTLIPTSILLHLHCIKFFLQHSINGIAH